MKSLIWIPIDLPKIPDISALCRPDQCTEGFAYWRFNRLTEKNSSAYAISEWKHSIRQGHPELINWFNLFPFLNIRNIKLNHQQREVGGHIDFTNPSANALLWNNNLMNEPCGYRIIVAGNRNTALWVEDKNGKRTMCSIPQTTDVYVLNHTSGVHGVADDLERWTIFCHAEIDSAKHVALLQRSLLKYGDHAIWEE